MLRIFIMVWGPSNGCTASFADVVTGRRIPTEEQKAIRAAEEKLISHQRWLIIADLLDSLGQMYRWTLPMLIEFYFF
jgi:hypothetical protein